MTDITSHQGGSRAGAGFKLVLFSLIGIFLFFVPVTIAEKSTILLDHAATAVATQLRSIAVTFVMLIAYGALSPFIRGAWKKNLTETMFSVLRVLGLVLAGMYLAGIGPESFFARYAALPVRQARAFRRPDRADRRLGARLPHRKRGR